MVVTAQASGSSPMNLDHVLVSREADFVTITMNRPQRRNALSLSHLRDLITAFDAAGESDASGIILAGSGPVFSAGHDFADVAEADEAAVRTLLDACLQLMELIESVPQPVVARVHALATAAGCQLVAACDLAVAADSAGFAAPGGKGGWFCHTPMVAIARNIGRKRAAELAYTGDTITAAQALEWGLLNRVVPAGDLDGAVADLLSRATRGSRASKALGKRTLNRQLSLPQAEAYRLATEVMAASSQTVAAREGMSAFLGKRRPEWSD
ncbi:enoyl-CoA hydratase-related protein [Nonomuraea sp. NPDC050394]|uniref:enoyl-CoA hydratase-related protein n=1 Tax=Nonomuraea sp. NPDC050394 TaxID=3364363 RepID=UPI00378C4BAC